MTIYHDLRKKRIIPDQDAEVDHGINAMEFLGAAFSPKNVKEHLVTLSGAPDWEVIFWKWDTFKLLARIKLNVVSPDLDPKSFTISMMTSGLKVVVTGEQTYRFMQVSSDLHTLEVLQDELAAEAPDGHEISKHYTVHTWTKDLQVRLMVCTIEGDILLANDKGEFIRYIEDSPYGTAIHTMFPF